MTFTKVSGNKVNMQKWVVFLYTKMNHRKIIIYNSTKRMNYLKINLTNQQKLWNITERN